MRHCYVRNPWYRACRGKLRKCLPRVSGAAQKLICYFDLESWISKWCPPYTQYNQDVDVVPKFLLYMTAWCLKCRIFSDLIVIMSPQTLCIVSHNIIYKGFLSGVKHKKCSL